MALTVKQVAIIVDWFGPYKTTKEAVKAARTDYSSGLYMVLGKVKHQKAGPKLQYIGLAKDLSRRLGVSAGVQTVTRTQRLWLGEITSVGIPGKKLKVTGIQIDLAEWAHAYFLQLPLNSKKTGKPPDRPVTIINRWWRKDNYETPHRRRPHLDWPDVIDFWGKKYGAKVAWFGGSRMEKWHPNDF